MPANAFRSWADHPVFKARESDANVMRLKINYYQLVANFHGNETCKKLLSDHFGLEDFERDVGTISRLEFIYWSDRIRAVVDDSLRMFIENNPLRILKMNTGIGEARLVKIPKPELARLVEKIGVGLASGSIYNVSEKLIKKFDLRVFTVAELRALNYIFEMRHLLVHRGDRVDQKFIEKTGSRLKVGDVVPIPRISHLSQRLMSIAQSLHNRLERADPTPQPLSRKGRGALTGAHNG